MISYWYKVDLLKPEACDKASGHCRSCVEGYQGFKCDRGMTFFLDTKHRFCILNGKGGRGGGLINFNNRKKKIRIRLTNTNFLNS